MVCKWHCYQCCEVLSVSSQHDDSISNVTRRRIREVLRISRTCLRWRHGRRWTSCWRSRARIRWPKSCRKVTSCWTLWYEQPARSHDDRPWMPDSWIIEVPVCAAMLGMFVSFTQTSQAPWFYNEAHRNVVVILTTGTPPRRCHCQSLLLLFLNLIVLIKKLQPRLPRRR